MKSKYEIEKVKWNTKTQLVTNSAKLVIRDTYEKKFSEQNALRPIYDFLKPMSRSNNNIRILDMGCGEGWASCLLSQKFHSVYSYDISFNRIRVLRQRMEFNQMTNIFPFVGDAEFLPFPDHFFDVVFGYAVLHHLDLEPVMKEISRVLKPGGRGVFSEPYGHNPAVQLFRYIKHNFVEKHKGTDHPLKNSDKHFFTKYFNNVQFMGSTLFRDKFSFFRPLERKLLTFKAMQNMANYVTILVEKN